MKTWFLKTLLPRILKVVFILWCRTLPCRCLNKEVAEFCRIHPENFILVLWHSRIFYLFYYLRNRPDLYLLISPSKDGDVLANLARLLGYSIIRGSSFKNAVPAARSLIKILRQGKKIVVVADGSRGPRHKAQLGSLQIASITGAPVIPITFNAKRKIELNSWDRFVIPLPFSPCTINFGFPLKILRDSDESQLENLRAELESSLMTITPESAP